MKNSHNISPLGLVADLLQEREWKALKMLTAVRFFLMALMIPMAWVLGFSSFDRIVTLSLCIVYTVVVCYLGYLIRHRRHLNAVGLIGAVLDIMMVGLLPFVWYTSFGGSDIPIGITLKTSVTLIAILLIALNTLAIRPLYPMLVTIGSLLVHLALLGAALYDQKTVFTTNYLRAYTTPELATGTVATQMVIVVLVGLILTLLSARARKMVIEAAQLQKTNVQLGRYFSPILVKKIAENPTLLTVGGERKNISSVFTDLEGFTSFVEENDPSDVVLLINGYLDELVRVAFKHGGTVDKIVGDAVHIIFGAPIARLDHPQKALTCALEIDAVAERYRAQSDSPIAMGATRIGVNTGTAIVGNFGGDAMFDYTAYGDTVNVAARLEGANKYIGTRICVSAAVVSSVPGFKGRPIGTLWLKGKSMGIEAFEPLSDTSAELDTLPDYLEAYQLMGAKQPEAEKSFVNLCLRNPNDSLSQYHLNRLRTGQSGTEIKLSGK